MCVCVCVCLTRAPSVSLAASVVHHTTLRRVVWVFYLRSCACVALFACMYSFECMYICLCAWVWCCSVRVKGLQRLEDGLKDFVAAETVDYKWSSDASAVPTQKRVVVKTLPPHLMVHLKRFDFDFETLANVKVCVCLSI